MVIVSAGDEAADVRLLGRTTRQEEYLFRLEPLPARGDYGLHLSLVLAASAADAPIACSAICQAAFAYYERQTDESYNAVCATILQKQ